mgnify:CR=1 FL=1
MKDKITRTCRTNYRAYHHEGQRQSQSIRYIVLHSTEGRSAESAASWFQNPSSSGSANLVVDNDRCYRTLGDHVIPWGAPPLNTHGIHIEQAGYAKWNRLQWLKNRNTIKRAAYKAAIRCKDYHIPARFLNKADLIEDFGSDLVARIPNLPGPLKGGITTHAVVTAAYGDSDHTDPGDGYPIDLFMTYLRKYLGSDHV